MNDFIDITAACRHRHRTGATGFASALREPASTLTALAQPVAPVRSTCVAHALGALCLAALLAGPAPALAGGLRFFTSVPTASGPPYPMESAIQFDVTATSVSLPNPPPIIPVESFSLRLFDASTPIPPPITPLPMQLSGRHTPTDDLPLEAGNAGVIEFRASPTPPSIAPAGNVFDVLIELEQVGDLGPALTLVPPNPTVPPNPIREFDVLFDVVAEGEGLVQHRVHFAIGEDQPLVFTNIDIGLPQSPAFHVRFELERDGDGELQDAPLFTASVVGTLSPFAPLRKSFVDAPDADGDGEVDRVVEGGQSTPTTAAFRIDFDAGNSLPPALIKDTVPAEWDVLSCVPEVGADLVLVSPAGAGGKSATKIEWFPTGNDSALLVTLRSRKHGRKYAPTSCGTLFVNAGAEAVDTATGAPLLDANGNPLISNRLCLAAVEDLDGGGIGYTGAGDEDGDGLADYVEACVLGTNPCKADTDGDGAGDGVDANPLDASVQ